MTKIYLKKYNLGYIISLCNEIVTSNHTPVLPYPTRYPIPPTHPLYPSFPTSIHIPTHQAIQKISYKQK